MDTFIDMCIFNHYEYFTMNYYRFGMNYDLVFSFFFALFQSMLVNTIDFMLDQNVKGRTRN